MPGKCEKHLLPNGLRMVIYHGTFAKCHLEQIQVMINALLWEGGTIRGHTHHNFDYVLGSISFGGSTCRKKIPWIV